MFARNLLAASLITAGALMLLVAGGRPAWAPLCYDCLPNGHGCDAMNTGSPNDPHADPCSGYCFYCMGKPMFDCMGPVTPPPCDCDYMSPICPMDGAREGTCVEGYCNWEGEPPTCGNWNTCQ